MPHVYAIMGTVIIILGIVGVTTVVISSKSGHWRSMAESVKTSIKWGSLALLGILGFSLLEGKK